MRLRFNPALQCVDDADCYGNQELCSNGVCVCQFWSPREQHRVAVYGGYMYLLGGFASRHQSYCDGMACGDIDAGGYRMYRTGPRAGASRRLHSEESLARNTMSRETLIHSLQERPWKRDGDTPRE